MTEIEFGKNFNQPVALALGMFDCVHTAHVKLLEKIKDLSKAAGCKTAVFTFANNPAGFYKSGKLVYTYTERLKRFKDEDVDIVVYKFADENFIDMPPEKFLETLKDTLNIKAIVCGEDFSFGKNASGKIDTLKNFCNRFMISLEIIKTVTMDNNKVSTSMVKQLLKDGDIEKANLILSKPYRIEGAVVSGKGIGSKLLYPTVNINFDADKMPIMPGVYVTKTTVLGKSFKSVTNFGHKPTFDNFAETLETHIIGISENLYNEKVTTYFFKLIRNIIKFESIEELKIQIEKDIEIAKSY